MNTPALSRAVGTASFDVLPWGFFQGASLHNLRQLVVLRNIAIVAQMSTVLVVYHGLSIDLPVASMVATIAALALFNLATWRRLGSSRPVSEKELLMQLLVDVAALTLLLAQSGGASNPFVGMFMLPLTITAACLSASTTWLVALVTVAAYSLLVLVHRPMFAEGDQARHLQLLVSTMWLNYAITAGMIAHFVVRIAGNLRQALRNDATAREHAIVQEHLMRIGTLAAGAAHELAQPLSRMSVMLDELKELEPPAIDAGAVRPLVHDMAQQLRVCHETLSALLSYGRQTIDTGVEFEAFDVFVRRCVGTFRTRRPHTDVRIKVVSPAPAPSMAQDTALGQAVLCLLDNAADMSADAIDIELGWDSESLYLAIRDHGPGLPPSAEDRVGKLFFTTKGGQGNGIGLCLAQVAISRLGGVLELVNAEGGGALARIVLPVANRPQA